MWVNRVTAVSLNWLTPQPIGVSVDEELVSPNDDVEFVGPDGPVLQWPDQGERGAVESVGSDMVRVVWERSPLFVAWPLDWVKRPPARKLAD